MKQPKFTIFTPTFNRAHTLSRPYESLARQTCRDFQWLVIDDGSSDGTAELVRRWQQEADFPIVYRYQPNSGKHVAYNRAVEAADGELFLLLDADDGLLPEALEVMLKWWLRIPEAEREGFTGVIALCEYQDGSPCSEPFHVSPLDTTSLELRFRYRARKDAAGFHRTAILRQFPFPEDKSVRFIPENLVWDAIGRKYKVRCVNERVCTVYLDAGDQVTKADPRRKALVKDYFLVFLNRDIDYFAKDPFSFLKWAVLYARYSLHLRDWSFLHPRRFSHAGAYLLCCLAAPLGLAVYVRDVIRREKQ